MPISSLNILFLGARNASRSILAESILNRLGAGRFRAFSGGCWPEGKIHPYTLDVMRMQNYELDDVRCKSWLEFARTFARPHAPDLDFVFTLCGDIVGETSPAWPGQPMVGHWGLPDPAQAEGSEAERRLAFAECHRMLYQRISVFLSLPFTSLSRLTLREHIARIGRMIDETAA